MTELALTRRLAELFGARDKGSAKEVSDDLCQDEYEFRLEMPDVSIEIDGFGKVFLAPDGRFRITTQQMKVLANYDVHFLGDIPLEAEPVGKDMFLVKLQKK